MHMPCPIAEIDELSELIIDELLEISPRTAVSFALTCRSLEEPVLKPLWKRQSSIINLSRVFPPLTHSKYLVSGRDLQSCSILYRSPPPQVIRCEPSPKDWNRLRRYVSWIRELYLSWKMNIPNAILSRLSQNSTNGVLCPNLERRRDVCCPGRVALA